MRGLGSEKRATLEAAVRDVDEFLNEPVAEEEVQSEEGIRRLVRPINRARIVLLREMERAEVFRSNGRSFEVPVRLGTLLRLARLELRQALKEKEG